ncbi:LysR family transcriptional regulator [Solimicrobium silvestre]|uniref:LysR substrate binding domain n=1 Tax=Solimicrobium silvestre TaxID=2099400 RepID=A0A2S9H064_9BURK|nr:LysR family transcriptional regulator [Solimicrobium silvestre]PRC93357.1 LysR substrate binding domain [Solimicrobium silvestre]
MNFLTLDLNLLRVFDAVMIEQNLTRAADKLAMTQPAVSNAVKRLRHAFNDELLIRTVYGVKPTPRAESIWPAIREALSKLEAAIAPPTFDPASASASFRMAMADSTAAYWMPHLVREIEKCAPGINARMVPLVTRDPRSMLLQGDIDIAVGFFPGVVSQLAGGQSSANSPIRHASLYTGRYVCVMRKDHPLANTPLTLETYCNAHHLLVSFSGRAHGLIDEILMPMKLQRHIILTVNQFFTAGRVVANSDLLTVLPQHLISSTGMANQLIWKELPISTPAVNVDMLWHEREARNPAHKWLRENLINLVEQTLNSENPQIEHQNALL